MIEKLEWLDRKILLAVNGDYPVWLDDWMSIISEMYTWFPLYVVCLFYLYRTLGAKAFGLSLLFIAATVAIADWGSVHFFKETFKRFRPCKNEELKALLYLVEGRCGGQYGFISSHAANHFAIATFLAGTIGRRWKWTRYALVLWAALIGLSRVYLGVHYPSDVAVGALYGILVASIFVYLLDRLVLRRNLKP